MSNTHMTPNAPEQNGTQLHTPYTSQSLPSRPIYTDLSGVRCSEEMERRLRHLTSIYHS